MESAYSNKQREHTPVRGCALESNASHCKRMTQYSMQCANLIKEQMNNLLRYNSDAVTRKSSHCIARSVSHANALCASSCVIKRRLRMQARIYILETQSTLVVSSRRCHGVVLVGIVCSLLYIMASCRWLGRVELGARCLLSSALQYADRRMCFDCDHSMQGHIIFTLGSD